MILEQAARLGRFSTFKLLQARGAPLGRRCLHHAAIGHKVELIKFSIDKVGLDPDVAEGQELPMHHGTPLFHAIYETREESDNVDAVGLLLDRGVDEYVPDCHGCGTHPEDPEANGGVEGMASRRLA